MVLGMASFTLRFNLLFYLQFRSVLYGCTCFWSSLLRWLTLLPNSKLSHTGIIQKLLFAIALWVLVSICLFCLLLSLTSISAWLWGWQLYSCSFLSVNPDTPSKCTPQTSKLLFRRGQIYPYCIEVSSAIAVIPPGSSSNCSAPDFPGFVKTAFRSDPTKTLGTNPRRKKLTSSTTFPQFPWQVNFIALLMKGVRHLPLLAQPL